MDIVYVSLLHLLGSFNFQNISVIYILCFFVYEFDTRGKHQGGRGHQRRPQAGQPTNKAIGPDKPSA
jgi:hypothetical protein